VSVVETGFPNVCVLRMLDVYFFRMQMFLWNNIFLSLGFDVKDHFKDFGGDAAAYVAPVSAWLIYFLAFL